MSTIDAAGNLHDRANGQFTGHLRAEADAATVLPTPTVTAVALKGRMVDSFTAEQIGGLAEVDVQAAIERHPYDPAAAEAWLRRQGDKNHLMRLAADAADRLRMARSQLIEHTVKAGVQRILQSHPDAIKAVVYDGGEGVSWSVQVPGRRLADNWDEMHDDLQDLTTSQVILDPDSLAPLCVGYDPATGEATGLTVNRHTGHLVEAELDLAKLAG